MSEASYAQWSILELMGHRRLAGYVTEQEIAGKGFLRIEIPGPNGTSVSQFYSPDSVYGLTPTTQEIARRIAARSSPAPVSPWELALPQGKTESVVDVEVAPKPGDDDEDEDPDEEY